MIEYKIRLISKTTGHPIFKNISVHTHKEAIDKVNTELAGPDGLYWPGGMWARDKFGPWVWDRSMEATELTLLNNLIGIDRWHMNEIINKWIGKPWDRIPGWLKRRVKNEAWGMIEGTWRML